MRLPVNASNSGVLDYDRFRSVWHRCLLNPSNDESDVIYRQLIDAYSEPQRRYHTLLHLERCLLLLDKIRPELQIPEALELAIWFHDVVYQPGAVDNEQRSADQFMATTNGVFDVTVRNTVYRHIMATRHDGSEVDNTDTKFLLDIDLASFGSPWAEFISDSDNLRLELKDLSDEEFYQKQAAFQDKLFAQPRFFKSDYFYDKYETQARQNRSDYLEYVRQKMQADR